MIIEALKWCVRSLDADHPAAIAAREALAQHDRRGKPMGWYGTLDDDFGFNRADFYLHESELVAKGLVLPLYTASPAPTVPDVDALAQFIREIDGKHQMGAGVMAERIVEWLAAAPEVRS